MKKYVLIVFFNVFTILVNAQSYYSPLHWASAQGASVMIEELLSKGYNINSLDYQKNTPLHIAVFTGQLDSASVLLEKGADPFSKNNLGQSPLNLAYHINNDSMYNLFLSKIREYKNNAEFSEKLLIHFNEYMDKIQNQKNNEKINKEIQEQATFWKIESEQLREEIQKLKKIQEEYEKTLQKEQNSAPQILGFPEEQLNEIVDKITDKLQIKQEKQQEKQQEISVKDNKKTPVKTEQIIEDMILYETYLNSQNKNDIIDK